MIDLSAGVQAVLVRALRHARGREICAYLLEGESGQQVFRVDNCALSRGDFHVPEHEIARMRAYASQLELAPKAFIHSHAGDLRLSREDEPSFAGDELPWIVVDLKDETLAWRCYNPATL